MDTEWVRDGFTTDPFLVPGAQRVQNRYRTGTEWVRKVSSAILLERARDQGQRTGVSMLRTSAACLVTPPTAWKSQPPFTDGWQATTARHGRAAARGRKAPISMAKQLIG